MNAIPEEERRTKARTPVVVGAIGMVLYLFFIVRSFIVSGGWSDSLLKDHYVFFVGLPFAGFLAYFIVGTLENVSGAIQFEALGLKFKGASGPIVMWTLVFLAIVLSMYLVWPLKP